MAFVYVKKFAFLNASHSWGILVLPGPVTARQNVQEVIPRGTIVCRALGTSHPQSTLSAVLTPRGKAQQRDPQAPRHVACCQRLRASAQWPLARRVPERTASYPTRPGLHTASVGLDGLWHEWPLITSSLAPVRGRQRGGRACAHGTRVL